MTNEFHELLPPFTSDAWSDDPREFVVRYRNLYSALPPDEKRAFWTAWIEAGHQFPANLKISDLDRRTAETLLVKSLCIDDISVLKRYAEAATRVLGELGTLEVLGEELRATDDRQRVRNVASALYGWMLGAEEISAKTERTLRDLVEKLDGHGVPIAVRRLLGL